MMTADQILGAGAALAVLAFGGLAVVGLRALAEWYRALPPRQRPQDASRERLARVWRVWLLALGLWGLSALIVHHAPREGLWGGMMFGLPELAAMLGFASRAAFGCLVAAAVDVMLWPRFSASAIVWPGEQEHGLWADVPVPLRAVGLAGWLALYIAIIGAALFIEPVL